MRIFMVLFLTLSFAITGCSGGKTKTANSDEWKAYNPNDKATIKAAFWNEEMFKQMYGNELKEKYPNIDFTVAVMPPFNPQSEKKWEDTMKEFVDKENPDLIFMDAYTFADLSQDGRLVNLEPIMKQEKFELSKIHPNLIDGLRQLTGGDINGLATNYYSQVLYFNKDLFDQAGIPYPKDQMTWEDFLQLTKRFASGGKGEDSIYGLSLSSPGFVELLAAISNAKGLMETDADGGKVALGSSAWKKVMQSVVDVYQSGSVYQSPNLNEAGKGTELFVKGQSAMTFGGSELARKLDDQKFKWDAVTMPIDSANPDSSSYASLTEIVAINSKASNRSAAWKVVEYINSEEKAAKIIGMGLLPRWELVKPVNGHSMEVFYKLKPDYTTRLAKNEISNQVLGGLNNLMVEELQKVITKKQSLDDAAKTIQEKGQALLDTSKK